VRRRPLPPAARPVAGAHRALPEEGEAVVTTGGLVELGSFVIGVELAG
jgi:hypothetical protein